MPPAGVPPHAPTPAGITLTENVHGKARVRVAKSTRPATPDGLATWTESTVAVLLRGGADAAFTDGDNSGVVSTDTVKNVVYVVAGRHPTTPPESFALAIAATFLAEYPHVGGADVTVTQPMWTRVIADGVPHPHGFLGGAGTRTASVSLERGGVPAVSGGLAGVRVLKTTASGWAGFHAGRYSTLPPTDDRVLCTDVTAEWRFADGWGAAGDELATTRGGEAPPDTPAPDGVGAGYDAAASAAGGAILATFFGDPADGGVYSPGVQRTLLALGAAVLGEADCEGVASVRLSLPNVHYLPAGGGVVPLLKGSPAAEGLYVPTDEPHGVIAAVVKRT